MAYVHDAGTGGEGPYANGLDQRAQRAITERRVPGPKPGSSIPEIVAEISGNHGGRIENALRLIREAKRAGANAVKFQCFEPEALALKRVGVIWHGKPQSYDELVALYTKTHTPKSWFRGLIRMCNDVGIAWFASAFSPDDVEFLESEGCPRYKISAYEMLDGDLINAVVATGKPIIMSVRSTDRVTVLEATDYDGKIIPLGISDHGKRHAFWSDRFGPMIERHLMLADVPCEDQDFSSTPEQFADYVRRIRQ